MPGLRVIAGRINRSLRRSVTGTTRAWFHLTPLEHRAVVLVLGLCLLGLAVRLWRAL